MKCIPSNQGTGTNETALCDNCYEIPDNRVYARKQAYPVKDIDPLANFVNCTENEALECCICGGIDT